MIDRQKTRALAVRRAINQAVYDLRLEISEARSKLADQRGEPAHLP